MRAQLVDYKLDLKQGFGTPDNPWLGPTSGCGAIKNIVFKKPKARMKSLSEQADEIMATDVNDAR